MCVFSVEDSLVEEELYFLADTGHQIGIGLGDGNKFKKIKNYHIRYRWKYFFEFFFYHAMYFFFFGPLVGLVFYKKPGVTLMTNLLFWGAKFSYF